MSDCKVDAGISIFVDRQSNAETAVIALVTKDEFARAQGLVPELAAYCDFEDWRESREAFQIGLAMAGVAAKMVPVVLPSFLAWCRLTRAAPSEAALDAFAATIWRRRANPETFVLAIVAEQEFQAYSHVAAALLHDCDYRQWQANCRRIRVQAAASGLSIEELPIVLDDFVKWRACLGQVWAATIHRYAHLVLENFTYNFDE